MSLPKVEAISKLFALAREGTASPPCFATPKLNGIRAMWVPGVGFISKDGVPYNDGVLVTLERVLEPCKLFLDGELYVHGWSLQQINSVAGVIRESPHEKEYSMQFHVFDTPHSAGGFESRQHEIKAHLDN